MVYFSTLCVKRFRIENLLVGNSVWLEPLMLNWWRRLSLGAACNRCLIQNRGWLPVSTFSEIVIFSFILIIFINPHVRYNDSTHVDVLAP